MGSRRWGVLVLTAALAALALTSCGDDTRNAVDSEVIADGKPVDRSPFEMAEPSERSASTTIPGAGPTAPPVTIIDDVTGETITVTAPPDLDALSTTTVPRSSRNDGPTIPAPTIPTTTTPPPTTTVYRPVPTTPYGDPMCGAAQQFALTAEAFSTISNSPTADQALNTLTLAQQRIRVAADLFATNGDPSTVGSTLLLSVRSRDLAAQFDETIPLDSFRTTVTTKIGGFFKSGDPALNTAFLVMTTHLKNNCPDLFEAFGTLPPSVYSPK